MLVFFRSMDSSKFVILNFVGGCCYFGNWQMMQQNASPGMRYMGGPGNRRNGMEGTAPQGIIPLPLDASAISHNGSQNPQKPPLLPISKLMSALALANPANHPQVFCLSDSLISLH